MPPHDDTDRIVKRLDRMAAEAPMADRQLGRLAKLASTGVPLAVGLLVDGLVIRGRTCTQDHYVEGLTASVRRMSEALFKDFPTVRDDIESVFKDEVARGQALDDADREVLLKYREDPPASIDEIAAEDVMAFLRGRRQEVFLHLADAHLSTAGADPAVVGLLRIRLSSVSAWWPLEEDRTANVIYGPPGEATTD